jgi:type II secretory pathway pseudopilin PulG
MNSGTENRAAKQTGAGAIGRRGGRRYSGVSLPSMGRDAHATKGFTLLELLVVIGIIILLVGILVPALSAARIAAQRAATEGVFNGLQSSISQFSQQMNGQLPGNFPQLSNGTQTVGSGASPTKKISGAQTLLLALSYSLSSPAALPATYPPGPGTVVALPDNSATVDPASPNGPMDLSVTPNKQYTPFYNPSLNDLKTYQSPVNSTFKLTDVANAWPLFPVIVDKFSDPLPILYFRVDQPSGAWAENDKSTLTAAHPISYYRQENSEYLDAKVLQSISGSTFDEYNHSSYSAKNGTGTGANTGPTNLGTAIQNAMGGGGATFANHGDYVLISAGADRIYGKNGSATLSDDVMRVGTK